MSETTRRVLKTDLIDLTVPYRDRVDQSLFIVGVGDEHALRPSRFAAEGGAEDETTNSPSEIGMACTGRKRGLAGWLDCWQFPVALSAVIAEAISLPLTHGKVVPALCIGLLAALSGLTVGLAERSRRRASGGEGV